MIETLREDLARRGKAHLSLPGGRLHVDRPVPFICVHRFADDAGEGLFVESAAAHAVGRDGRELRDAVGAVADEMVERFGQFLVLEVWTATAREQDETPAAVQDLMPGFRILASRRHDLGDYLDRFEQELARVRIGAGRPWVRREWNERCTTCRTSVLPASRRRDGVHLLGLEIQPVHRDPATGDLFPTLARKLQRSLSRALRRALYDFAHTRTTQRPAHYHVLGRSALAKTVWSVDRVLAEVSGSFDLLTLVTPTNQTEALQDFRRSGWSRAPVFHYRPLDIDPVDLKRRLWNAPVLRLEDPALTRLFREAQDDVDRQLTMLLDRNTRRFKHESVQAFGAPKPETLATAHEILAAVSPRSREPGSGSAIDAEAFAQRMRDAVRGAVPFRDHADADLPIEVVSGIGSTIMVSNGRVLIGHRLRVPAGRVDALIAHEVFTHLLTYENGRRQRFRQLATGLAGYEAFQEGIAVLSEFLVGGLTRARLRLLAARVVAAQAMIDGAEFVDTFRLLRGDLRFGLRAAFGIAVRIHRGGGFCKDAVYLAGLLDVLRHLRRGGDLEPLLVGKISVRHVAILEELAWRGIVAPPAWTPPYLADARVRRRLEIAREVSGPLELVRSKR